MNKELTESLEKYLLAIYKIVKENKAARVKDVSNYLNIGTPSASDAIKTLAERKYINYVPYGIITITPKGKKKAESKIKRHNVIANFLEKVLMIEKDKIEENTKKIEYSMSEDVLNKFIQFLTFLDNCSCKEPKWAKSYKYYAENDCMQEKCKICSGQKEKFDNSNCCSSCCNI